MMDTSHVPASERLALTCVLLLLLIMVPFAACISLWTRIRDRNWHITPGWWRWPV